MEKIEELKNRIAIIEKLFNNTMFQGYECFEKQLLLQPDYKEYFLVKHGLTSKTLEQSFLKAITGEDLNLYAAVTTSVAWIRLQYEEDKKELEKIENGR